MLLTSRQKDLIRKELSGEENTLLWLIKQDVQSQLRPIALDEEEIEILSRIEQYFKYPDYVVSDRDPEVDDIILRFEEEILWIWGAIRRHVILYPYEDNYDIDFDKEAILKEIDEEVNSYLQKLEDNSCITTTTEITMAENIAMKWRTKNCKRIKN